MLTTFYYLSVLLVAGLAAASTDGKLPRQPRLRYWTMFAYSLLYEWPLVFVFVKIAVIVVVSMMGVFSSWVANMFYVFDLLTMIALIVIFVDGYEAKHSIETALESYIDKELPSFSSETFWQRMVSPRFVPKEVTHYVDISYAIHAEMMEARKDGVAQTGFLALDIYARKDVERLRPVLVFVHGGGWVQGDKSMPYPLIRHMAEAGWIVVSMNYRLAPASAYPAQLIDVKRALRWVKGNIEAFKGDPNWIAIAGDDAGGHLAALVALTPNDPKYQPDFTSVDTTVRAAVLINPITDLVDERRLQMGDFGDNFCREIARLPRKDVEFLKEHSPLSRIRADTVPFLIFHGNRDTFVPFIASQLFADAFREHKATECQFVQIPGGHHAYHLFSSPRSHYQAIGVELWLNHMHRQGRKTS